MPLVRFSRPPSSAAQCSPVSQLKTLRSGRMPSYTLHLEFHPDGDKEIRDFQPPPGIKAGDTLTHDGFTWRVMAIAVSQDEPDLLVLRCWPV